MDAQTAAGLGAHARADDSLEGMQRRLDAAPRPVMNAAGVALRVVAARAGGALAYERSVHERGELPVQPGSRHDRCNVEAWCRFPRVKARINAGHVAEDGRPAGANGRTRRRDALTLLDEAGALVAVSDPRVEPMVRAFAWRRLFVEHRALALAAMRCEVVGHGLMASLERPFVGLTARALFVPLAPSVLAADETTRRAALDETAAALVDALAAPADLAPLPVLGIPGWWPANEDPAFYDNRTYFRPGRTRATRTPAPGGAG